MDSSSVQDALEATPAASSQLASKSNAASSLISSHMPGIDVLRGIAIVAVLIFHGFFYSNPKLTLRNPLQQGIYGLTAWGFLGVNLFFVLSGFLITGILDDTRERSNYYARFYIRRALRILPAYVAILLLCLAAGSISGNYFVICLLFLANMPGLLLHHGYLLFPPLWSLAVEEQFYLVWPALYRRMQRQGMLTVCLLLMVVCPVLRGLAFAHILHTGEPSSKTWMIADNLAIGAILAIVLRSPTMSVKRFVEIGWVQAGLGIFGLIVLASTHHLSHAEDPLRNSFGLSCFMLLCSSAVIAVLCRFRTHALPRGLQIFIFFGDISYGLYLVHMLLLQLYDRAHPGDDRSGLSNLLVRFLIANGLAIGLAVVSKRYFEDPFLRLKGRIAAAR